VTVVLLFPTAHPVTLQNMNYVVVAAGNVVFALGWWWAEVGGA
jgi:hypothetical protein